jgi:hypothetical protein
MMQEDRTMSVARGFIGRAMDLLDQAGETRATFHLQFALDILTNAPIPATTEEVEAAMEIQRLASKMSTALGSKASHQ